MVFASIGKFFARLRSLQQRLHVALHLTGGLLLFAAIWKRPEWTAHAVIAYSAAIAAFAVLSNLFFKRHVAELNRLAREMATGRLSDKVDLDIDNTHIRQIGRHLELLRKRLTDQESTIIGAEARHRAVLEATNDAVVTLDAEATIETCNRASEAMLGYNREELQGKAFEHLLDEHDRPLFARSLELPGTFLEAPIRRKSGATFEARIGIRDGVVLNRRFFALALQDVTERNQFQQQVAYLIQNDALTGLPNRIQFHEQLSLALAESKQAQQCVGVLFLNLDRFKIINDTLGHEVGDLLLTTVAGRLKNCLRQQDFLARWGADEFTLILGDLSSAADANVIAQRIVSSLSQPFKLAGNEVFVTPSVGISLYPFDDDKAEHLVRNADGAMRTAKALGGGTHQFFSFKMQGASIGRLAMETSLRHAVDRGEFLLHYQPQIDLSTGRIIGTEALLRWNSRELGPVSPAQFIPLAEETGLIVPIGEWTLKEACRQNHAWISEGLDPGRVAVNLSARQFRQHNLMTTITRALAESGLDADALDLELTESAIMQQADETIATLRQIKERGIQISIDDFGTGYSSLSYLKRFPIDILKIDQTFVRELNSNPDDAAISSTIIAMAHSLKMKVIAEGVETAEQLAFLKANHCDSGQGYYFSKPIPGDALATLLRTASATSTDFACVPGSNTRH